MGLRKAAHIGDLDADSAAFFCREEIGEVFVHDRGNYVKYFHPTTDPADAMEVLEKCLQKLGGHEQVAMSFDDTTKPFIYGIRMAHANWDWIYAETLPLSICKLAKKLFTKENP